MFDQTQKDALAAKLDGAHVKSRQQAGRSLSYIEGWHAIAEANRIFGFDGWNRELLALKQLGEPREIDSKYRVAYMATVRVTVLSDGANIVRDGTGYGSGIDKDLGSAHESAIKEAETDAMKRALMTFGNPFGLALYDKTQENVEREPERKRDDPPPADPDEQRYRDRVKSITRAIDACGSLSAVNTLMVNYGWNATSKVADPDTALAEIRARNIETYDFLLRRAEDRRNFFASHPDDKKAA